MNTILCDDTRKILNAAVFIGLQPQEFVWYVLVSERNMARLRWKILINYTVLVCTYKLNSHSCYLNKSELQVDFITLIG